jgi:7-cyano-7-deazaguanine synthase
MENGRNKKTIVLLSGGLDSTTALYWARAQGYQPHCLVIDYGQCHRREIQSAEKIAQMKKISYQIIHCEIPWRGSALLDPKIQVPKRRSYEEMKAQIPMTYVPARNILFLSYALSWAETISASAIVIGANQLDWSGYPDCRGEFFKAFEKVIEKGTRLGVEGKAIQILAPLLSKTKSEIVLLGKELGVPFEQTWSCYQGENIPCGSCDSCRLREKGFQEAGVDDPLGDTVF